MTFRGVTPRATPNPWLKVDTYTDTSFRKKENEYSDFPSLKAVIILPFGAE
jgi:hypothetical protein